ncbi:MAG TPA: hypothetical protein VFB22_03760 [Candidatus Baltobacteraceae bacterium]|nr:hypothetical protein [Candidatus Baltobacteraceae bacterium]
MIVHREPRDGAYADVRSVHRGDVLSPLAFPDLRLAVSSLFAHGP